MPKDFQCFGQQKWLNFRNTKERTALWCHFHAIFHWNYSRWFFVHSNAAGELLWILIGTCRFNIIVLTQNRNSNISTHCLCYIGFMYFMLVCWIISLYLQRYVHKSENHHQNSQIYHMTFSVSSIEIYENILNLLLPLFATNRLIILSILYTKSTTINIIKRYS